MNLIIITSILFYTEQIATSSPGSITPAEGARIPLQFVGDETIRKEIQLRVVNPPQGESFQVYIPVNAGRLEAMPTPGIKETRQGDTRNVPIDFRAVGLPRGQYEGTFRVLAPNGTILNSAPITVSAKHSPILAWLTALFGVTIGIALSYYKREGQQVDEMTVGAHELKVRLLADSNLRADPTAVPFRDKINRALAAYEVEFESGNWEPAHANLVEATRCFKLWAAERDRWLHALGNLFAQFENLQFLGPMREAAVSFLRSIADEATDTPNVREFARKVESARGRMVAAEGIAKRFQDLKESSPHLRDPGEVGGRIAILEDKLRCMTGDQFAMTATMDGLLDEVQGELGKLAEQLRAENAAADEAHELTPTGVTSPLLLRSSNSSDGHARMWEKSLWIARAKLLLHAWVVTALAVAALTSMGMLQLYYKNSDFGTLWDYAAIFVWGLGAESSTVSAKEWLRTASGKDKSSND